MCEILSHVNQKIAKENQLNYYLTYVNLTTQQTGHDDGKNPIKWSNDSKTIKTTKLHDMKGNSVFKEFVFPLNINTRALSISKLSTSDLVLIKNENIWGQYLTESVEEIHIYNEKRLKRTRNYGKYFLLSWPKRFEFDMLLTANPRLAFDEFYSKYVNMKKRVDQETLDHFQSLLIKFSAYSHNLLLQYFPKMFELLKKINQIKFVHLFSTELLPKMYFVSSWILAKLVTHFGIDRMKKIIASTLKSDYVFNSQFILVNIMIYKISFFING